MSANAALPAPRCPARRPELVVRPLGEDGRYVVKDPQTGAYYHLGDEEHFLLSQLDGQRDPQAIRDAFEERFGQPLDDEDLNQFLETAREQGLLQPPGASHLAPGVQGAQSYMPRKAEPDPAPLGLRILYWRKNFFDPDRFFTWLAPRIWFFWTPVFLVFSAASIVLATALVWANGDALVGSVVRALRWETFVLGWLTLVAVTF